MFGFLVNTPHRDSVTVRQCVCYVPLFAQRARPGLARNTAAARNYVCTQYLYLLSITTTAHARYDQHTVDISNI